MSNSEDKRPNKEGRNGSLYLLPCLDSHDPLDLVILMLGTNELKHEFKNSAREIGKKLEKYFIKIILNRKSQFRNTFPKLLIISPPLINEETKYSQERYILGAEKSRQLGNVYSQIARKYHCFFIDAGKLKVGSDGVHMTKESHIKLAKIIASKVRSIEF